MTAEQHLAEAERLISRVSTAHWDTETVAQGTMATLALVHAIIAAAIELGVPHAQPAGTGAGDGGK